MARIRTAVIGAGYFGAFHADKHARIDGAELVAVVDADVARAAEVAGRHGAAALGDIAALAGRVDAVSVAVPTRAHHDVVMRCLDMGLHVLVEKPIARTLAEAQAMVARAAERGLVLQVGHLERFHAAALATAGLIRRPLFIECHRIHGFKDRGTDVDVVLDLMIHDIDLILALVRRPVESIDAVGAPVMTSAPDIANARLRFAGGCVANVTASRISLKNERKMRIFQPDCYLSIDLMARRYTLVRAAGRTPSGRPAYEAEVHEYSDADALELEVASFVAAVATGSAPPVTGADGVAALDTALRIGEAMAASAVAAGIGSDDGAA